MKYPMRAMHIIQLMSIVAATCVAGSHGSADDGGRDIDPTLKDDAIKSQAEHSNKADGPWIAWLMSFSNSGTSYTLNRLIGPTSQTRVATNYCHSSPNKTHPVYSGHSEGPLWQFTSHEERTRPTKYILTKTHCGFYCNGCAPEEYMDDALDFTAKCSSGFKMARAPDGKSNQKVHVTYDSSVVHKTIHLIRNPFNNVVSRFHLARQQKKHLSKYRNSRHGFRKYCESQNSQWKDEVEASWLTNKLSMMKNIPCRDDFYRYVRWHNQAFVTTDDELDVPTHLLHYEDYAERFDETVDGLMDFLHLKQRNVPDGFSEGHAYADYYTDEERRAVTEAMKILATNKTWSHIQHYFN